MTTRYGVSDPVYGTENQSLAGIGQGNVLGPALWCLINFIIFNMCKAKDHGITIISSISKTVTLLIGFAFVDNAYLVSGPNDVNATGVDLIPEFQALILGCNGGIRASGGLIAPQKTHWFLIDFFCTGNNWEYHTKQTMPGGITLPDKDGVPYVVTQKEPSSAHKSLGETVTLIGDQSAQEYKDEMDGFVYCPTLNRAIEASPSTQFCILQLIYCLHQ